MQTGKKIGGSIVVEDAEERAAIEAELPVSWQHIWMFLVITSVYMVRYHSFVRCVFVLYKGGT